jgi:hypothetical protein
MRIAPAVRMAMAVPEKPLLVEATVPPSINVFRHERNTPVPEREPHHCLFHCALLTNQTNELRDNEKANGKPHQRLKVRLKDIAHLNYSFIADDVLNRIEYYCGRIAKAGNEMVESCLTGTTCTTTT